MCQEHLGYTVATHIKGGFVGAGPVNRGVAPGLLALRECALGENHKAPTPDAFDDVCLEGSPEHIEIESLVARVCFLAYP